MDNTEQPVDPAISRKKFDRELDAFHAQADVYRKRGWWLLEATFPEVLVAFVTTTAKPPAVAFGALLNFENYDFVPPSVRIVNPLTREAWRCNELPIPPFLRRVNGQPVPILQAHAPQDIPFLCLPGVREYHEHPGHSADDWLLHRRTGAGTLYFLLEKLELYGLRPLAGYQAQVQFQVKVDGFGIDLTKVAE